MVQIGVSRRFTAIVTGVAAGLLLAGCINFSALDDLEEATPPTGSPFNQALFQNYAFLARSFGDVGQASYTAFDQEASIPLTKIDGEIAKLANAYASKALFLSRGEAVDPEPSRDLAMHRLRDRLVRALTPGRDTFPRDAARAQADYDCWVLNSAVASQAQSAAQCQASFEVTLAQLENEVQTTAQPPEAGATPPAAGTTPPAAGATPPAADATPPATDATPAPATAVPATPGP